MEEFGNASRKVKVEVGGGGWRNVTVTWEVGFGKT